MSSETRPLKAALIGLQHGHMGSLNPASPRGFLGTFTQMPGVEVVALCEPQDAAALEREAAFLPGLHAYHSVQDLISSEKLDLAVIGLPANEAAPAITALAGQGVHSFVEKSVARTADDLLPAIAAAQKTGAHVLVDYPWRHQPAVVALTGLMKEGVLGKPTSILACMTTSQVGTLPGQRNPNSFAYRPDSEGGGMLHWLGAHFVEAICALMGDVTAVSAMCAPVVGNMASDPRMDDVSSVSFQFASGAVGTLHTGYLNAVAGENRDFIRVWGVDGDALWPSLGPTLHVSSRTAGWKDEPSRTLTFDIKSKEGVYGNKQWMFDLAQSFVQGIHDGTRPAVGLHEAWRVYRIIDAAYESSQSKRWVEIGPGPAR